MAYDRSDPRSALATRAPETQTAATTFAAPQYFAFHEIEPTETHANGTRSWCVRGQNLVVEYTEAKAGTELVRRGQPDEYVIMLYSAGAEVSAGDATERVGANALCIVPPGDSRLRATSDGVIVRLFSVAAEDMVARCINARAYDAPHPNVAPLTPWPAPPAGYRLRVYRIDDYPLQPGRFGRIFRCTTIMVNWGDGSDGPRDPSRMSPHAHEDFEQCSLCLAGDYVHHIRTPWTSDLAAWRDDEHRFIASPSLTIIPPPTIHTSQAVNEGFHHLIDIFSPPRLDFSQQPGWVLNADEYPMP